MEIVIIPRARKFGYLIWPVAIDNEVKSLMGDRDHIELVFNKDARGEKRIDWKYRRISIGWRWTRLMPESHKYFNLSVDNGILTIHSS